MNKAGKGLHLGSVEGSHLPNMIVFILPMRSVRLPHIISSAFQVGRC